MESKELQVELKPGRPSYMVLKGTYGDRVHQAFKMTRQGVRWRFWRIFNDAYVAAFESILHIEKIFGTQLREHAIRISRERYEMRQRMAENGFQSADSLAARRQTPEESVNRTYSKM